MWCPLLNGRFPKHQRAINSVRMCCALPGLCCFYALPFCAIHYRSADMLDKHIPFAYTIIIIIVVIIRSRVGLVMALMRFACVVSSRDIIGKQHL